MAEIKRKIKIPIYDGILSIVITDDYDVYQASKSYFGLDQENLKNCNAAVLQRQNYLPRIYPIVFSRNCTPGIIAHEANHFMNYLFSDLGIKRDMHNDEAESYFLAWIVDYICSIQDHYIKSKITEYVNESNTSENRKPSKGSKSRGSSDESTESNTTEVSEQSKQRGFSRHKKLKQTNTYF